MAGLMARFGFRPFLILGPALIIAGMAWTCFLPVHGDYALHVLPGLLIMPVGYEMSFAPMYAAATTGVEPRLAGITSGLISASQQMGGAVGLTLLALLLAVTVIRAPHSSHSRGRWRATRDSRVPPADGMSELAAMVPSRASAWRTQSALLPVLTWGPGGP